MVNVKKILRLLGWGLGVASLYAMFSVCPFCGRQGCPVGAGSAGLVGGVSALLMQNWKTLFKKLSAGLRKKKNQDAKRPQE